MDLLVILRLREMLVDIFDGDEGSYKVIPVANISQPGFFDRITCSSMKVSHRALDAWQFINIVDGICG